MKIKSRFSWLILLIAQFSGLFSFANATTDIPGLTVVGYKPSGVALQCVGTDCVQSAQEEAAAELVRLQKLQASVSQDDVPIDPSKFCSRLLRKKSPNCNPNNPPSSPGYDPNWTANGCGSGSYQKVFATVALKIANSKTFSGNLDSPYAGVSFLAACNSHDRCWANANPRATCDLNFKNDMMIACGATQGAANNVCSGYAGMYHGAVATTDAAEKTYNQSVADRRCAEIVHDLKANGCKQK